MIVNEIENYEPALTVNDLKQCKKIDNTNWNFEIKAKYQNEIKNKSIKFKTVSVQGIIEQKPCNDVMILRDCTGRVKLVNCTSGTTNIDKIVRGVYCAVKGTLVRESGLPEISVYRIIQVGSNDDINIFYNSWSFEVKDFKLFVLGLIKPSLNI